MFNSKWLQSLTFVTSLEDYLKTEEAFYIFLLWRQIEENLTDEL